MGFGSFLGGIAGSAINAITSNHANKVNQAFAEKQWQNNYQAQKEFAQNGVRWKVEDATRSGIHPLFALGASGSSFSPVNTQSYYENPYSSLGSTLSNMGQNIDRAREAKSTSAERALQELRQNELYSLDVRQREADIQKTLAEADIAKNQALASAKIARNQQQVPPLPSNTGNDTQAIPGQLQSNQYGVIKDVLDSAQWYRTPDGGYMIAPSQDLMDLVSEDIFSKTQFYTMLTEAFYSGVLKPPRKAKPGHKWYINASSGTIVERPISDEPLTTPRYWFKVRAPMNFGY